jgi:hypothetical protein
MEIGLLRSNGSTGLHVDYRSCLPHVHVTLRDECSLHSISTSHMEYPYFVGPNVNLPWPWLHRGYLSLHEILVSHVVGLLGQYMWVPLTRYIYLNYSLVYMDCSTLASRTARCIFQAFFLLLFSSAAMLKTLLEPTTRLF